MGIRYELLIGERAGGVLSDLSALPARPEGGWWVRPVERLDAAGLEELVRDLSDHAVDRVWLEDIAPQDAAVLAELPVTALRLHAKHLDDAALEGVAAISGLVELDAGGCAISGEGLAGLHGLEVLGLSANPLRELRAVRSLKRLRHLDLSASPLPGDDPLDDSDLADLGALRDLEVLSLRHRRGIDGSGLRWLAKLKRLQSLDLAGTSLVHLHLPHLAGLPIRNLDLSRTPLVELGRVRKALEEASETNAPARMVLAEAWRDRYEFRWEDGYGDFFVEEDSGTEVVALPAEEDFGPEPSADPQVLARLRMAAELFDLDIRAYHGPLPGFSVLRELPALRRLTLNGTLVGDDELGHLLPEGVERLDLAHSAVGDAGLVHLAGVHSIRMLDLSRTQVSSQGVSWLSRLTLDGLRLEGVALDRNALVGLDVVSLALHDCTLEPGSLTPAGKMDRLKTLSLFRSRLEDAGTGALRTAGQLDVLDCTRCRLSPPDGEALGQLRQVRYLRLTRTNADDEVLIGLRRLKNLEYLSLAYSQVTREGVEALEAELIDTEIIAAWEELALGGADEEEVRPQADDAGEAAGEE